MAIDPNVRPPHTYEQLYDNFGDPNHPDFEEKYIVDLFTTIANKKRIHIRCHVAIAQKLKAVFADLTANGHIDLVKSYDGCYVVRNIRGGSNPSLHSWGVAIDLGADEYPLGSDKRYPQPVLDAFKNHGFFYGGDFKHRKDPQHWEYSDGNI